MFVGYLRGEIGEESGRNGGEIGEGEEDKRGLGIGQEPGMVGASKHHVRSWDTTLWSSCYVEIEGTNRVSVVLSSYSLC